MENLEIGRRKGRRGRGRAISLPARPCGRSWRHGVPAPHRATQVHRVECRACRTGQLCLYLTHPCPRAFAFAYAQMYTPTPTHAHTQTHSLPLHFSPSCAARPARPLLYALHACRRPRVRAGARCASSPQSARRGLVHIYFSLMCELNVYFSPVQFSLVQKNIFKFISVQFSLVQFNTFLNNFLNFFLTY